MSLVQTLYSPVIGFDNRSLVDRSPVAITWPGTSSPGLTLGEITLPTYTATWPGTSDPSLTIT